jgi:phage shock protein C
MVLGTIFGSGALFVAYLIIAWLANPKPLGLYDDAEDAKFWQGVRQSPARSTRDVRSKFRDIDRRLADVETYYTSRNSSLANEIDSLR